MPALRLAVLACCLTALTIPVLAAPAPSAAKRSPRTVSLEARAAPAGPLRHAGRWITAADGRVVVTHGVNMVYKRPPYTPAASGFDAPDADWLRDNGFNSVRLGAIYAGVEPHPGTIDHVYVDDVARTEALLARRRIFTLLDFHQDLFSERFGGEGFPAWSVDDDGLPAQPLVGFPYTYLTSAGLQRAFDNFYANARGPGGVGLLDRYATAWNAVAAAFAGRPWVMGYDLINEPWGGSQGLTCVLPSGCPHFEERLLAPAQRRMIGAIRAADDAHTVWYEPVVTSQFGLPGYAIPAMGDPNAGMSFHDYCAVAAVPAVSGDCDQLEEQSVVKAFSRARENGDTLMLSEFGATSDPATIERMVDRADRHMLNWQWWHYCGCADPTTSGPGDAQALVSDARRAPSGDNVLSAKVALVERPYPQVVGGTPTAWSFDRATRRFTLAYSTRRADGGGRFSRALTDIFVPRLHYPAGYAVKVTGAAVLSKPGRQHLILRADAGARDISVEVTPAG